MQHNDCVFINYSYIMQVIALHLKVGEEDSAAYHLTLLKRIKMVCFPTFTHFQKV